LSRRWENRPGNRFEICSGLHAVAHVLARDLHVKVLRRPVESDPKPVRGRRLELPINQIRRPDERVVRDRGDFVGLAPTGTRQAHIAHQTLDGAASHADVLTVQLGPDLVGAIDEEFLVKEPLDLNLGSYRDLRLQSAFGYDGHMTEMTVELPDDLAERIQMRAQAEGRSLSEVIAEALGTVLDENPFEFVAAFGSTEVTGASADAYLRRENFGE